MARTIAEIQAEIIAAKNADPTLSGLTSASATAIWRLWTYVQAVAIWTLEVNFDNYRIDLLALLAKQKPHTLRWYQEKSLAFQFGSALPVGSDEYDNSALGPDAVAAQKIVKQAAAVETNGQLFLKTARLDGAALAPLTTAQFNAFVGYIGAVKDAGVKVNFINAPGDKLRLTLEIRFDPLVLGTNGARLDGTNAAPVAEAIDTFLKSQPFNGLFIKSHLVDFLQKIDGVLVPEIRLCQAARHDVSGFAAVDIAYQPFSGFLRFENPTDLVINYIDGVQP